MRRLILGPFVLGCLTAGVACDDSGDIPVDDGPWPTMPSNSGLSLVPAAISASMPPAE